MIQIKFKMFHMKHLPAFLILFFLFGLLSRLEADKDKKSRFIFSPMAGWIKNEVEFTLSGSKKKIDDSGYLYGVHMLYVNPSISLGALSHYSKLDKSYENGHLLFSYYYFRKDKNIQPMVGFALEYIHFYTQLPTEDVSPLISLDVESSIWAFHPSIGIAYKYKNFRFSPFIGYFYEDVNMVISSPGMKISGQNRSGFKTKSSVALDYVSLGSKIESALYHFIKLETKFYFRLRRNEERLVTVRNRMDLYFSKRVGLSTKFDYFMDKYDTNYFLFFGPTLVF